MHGEEIAPRQQLIDVGYALNAKLRGLVRGHEGIVADHFHVHAGCAPGHLTANAPETDDTERLAGELRADKLVPLPFARAHTGVRSGDMAGDGHQQANGLFGSTDRVAARW